MTAMEKHLLLHNRTHCDGRMRLFEQTSALYESFFATACKSGEIA